MLTQNNNNNNKNDNHTTYNNVGRSRMTHSLNLQEGCHYLMCAKESWDPIHLGHQRNLNSRTLDWYAGTLAH